MKKRILSIITTVMLAAAVVMPAAAEYTYGAERTSMPSFTSAEGKAWYYTNNNIFYKVNMAPTLVKNSKYGNKYVSGNCTWYAYARASEMSGKWLNSNFRYSASSWWSINKNGNYYSYGSKPKVGAIACYGSHVAVVEKVSGSKVYVSESGWTLTSTKPKSAADLKFHYGTPWQKDLKGYIYVMDSAAENASSVDYSIKVTAKDLNMRTGPGTGYSKIGYIKPGTYKISKEYKGWGQLADNGYWVYLKYTSKVTAPSSSVVETGTAADYKVKISVTNLNMRTGPGTSYAKKGYIKPGTYTVNLTNNGWGRITETGYWIYLKYTSKADSSASSESTASGSTLYKVKVTATGVNMRTGPGTSYSSKGKVTKGTVYDIKDTKNGWGQLSKNGYWIYLTYTIPVNDSYNVKVTASDLNMRSGPGVLYSKKGYIKPGIYTISKTDGGWGQLAINGYWIKLSYTTKI